MFHLKKGRKKKEIVVEKKKPKRPPQIKTGLPAKPPAGEWKVEKYAGVVYRWHWKRPNSPVGSGVSGFNVRSMTHPRFVVSVSPDRMLSPPSPKKKDPPKRSQTDRMHYRVDFKNRKRNTTPQRTQSAPDLILGRVPSSTSIYQQDEVTDQTETAVETDNPDFHLGPVADPSEALVDSVNQYEYDWSKWPMDDETEGFSDVFEKRKDPPSYNLNYRSTTSMRSLFSRNQSSFLMSPNTSSVWISTDNPTLILNSCICCLDKPAEYAIYPCGHLCMCESCNRHKLDQCPSCRGDVKDVIRIFPCGRPLVKLDSKDSSLHE